MTALGTSLLDPTPGTSQRLAGWQAGQGLARMAWQLSRCGGRGACLLGQSCLSPLPWPSRSPHSRPQVEAPAGLRGHRGTPCGRRPAWGAHTTEHLCPRGAHLNRRRGQAGGGQGEEGHGDRNINTSKTHYLRRWKARIHSKRKSVFMRESMGVSPWSGGRRPPLRALHLVDSALARRTQPAAGGTCG